MAARKDGKAKVFRKRICKKCDTEFIPLATTQVYCGSKTKETGCSWLMVLERDRQRGKLPHRKKAANELQKKWKKKQRAENTEYAKRQRNLKLEKSKTDHGKNLSKAARKRNIKSKLEANRQRRLKKKGVMGKHTASQWETIKALHDFKCAKCGISELDLRDKWKGQFDKLTKDHILPIARGGSDNYTNIQPLCISCNAKKKDDLEKPIVCVSGYFQPIHAGHIQYILGAAEYGHVIVILNSDDASRRKNGASFMPWDQRATICGAIRGVIDVVHVDDTDGTVCEALRRIKPMYFAKGGDRTADNTPEREFCGHLGIEILWGVGGSKVESSSNLLAKWIEEDGHVPHR